MIARKRLRIHRIMGIMMETVFIWWEAVQSAAERADPQIAVGIFQERFNMVVTNGESIGEGMPKDVEIVRVELV
jgi:hypothetical protein